jgi:hypothetical protein
MYGRGKSDRLVVPAKPRNKGEGMPHPAEAVEGRSLAKGNLLDRCKDRAQHRGGTYES